jgi:hypothetical protein
VKRPRGDAGNQRADEEKHAKTDQTGNCGDKDRRKFQLLRPLNHAGTIPTRPKKIERNSKERRCELRPAGSQYKDGMRK